MQEWASLVVSLTRLYKADYVLAEGNQGGDLVRLAIQNVSPNVYVKIIHQKLNKMERAEKALVYYEQEKVKHLNNLFALEEEMLVYDGQASKKSPNRLDALTQAIIELMSNPSMAGWAQYYNEAMPEKKEVLNAVCY